MNLLLLGATGRVGRRLLEQALADGHFVTALVRDPGKLGDETSGQEQRRQPRVVQGDAAKAVQREQPRRVQGNGTEAVQRGQLRIMQGNASNAGDLQAACKGADAVLCALSTDGGTVLADCAPLLVNAMEVNGVKRIVSIGTAGILNSRGDSGKLRYETDESRRTLTRASEEHRRFYLALRQSELDWTIVCPTYLPDEPATGVYRVERDLLPEGGSRISVADTAAFAYAQLGSDGFVGSRVGIAY